MTFSGERGATGDHGQDGRTGEAGQRGERGATGAAGGASPDDLDRLVATTLAATMLRQRRRVFNSQMLVLFAFVVFATVLLLFIVDRRLDQEARDDQAFRRAAIANCQRINEGNGKVNQALAVLSRNARSNAARSPQERAMIAAQYEALRLPVSKCPP